MNTLLNPWVFAILLVICLFLYRLAHPMKKVTLVVARYREDVSWLKEFDSEHFDIYCYNKGEPMEPNTLPSHVVQIPLHNVGREANTYLYHILLMHNRPMTDYVVFLQGHPFDHIGGRNASDLKNTILEHTKHGVDASTIMYNVCDEDMDKFPELHMSKYMNHFGFHCNKDKNMITFVPGAQFIIHKDDILRNPISFYQELFDYSNHDYYNHHPPQREFVVSEITAYTIERLWLYIFGFHLKSDSCIIPPSN